MVLLLHPTVASQAGEVSWGELWERASDGADVLGVDEVGGGQISCIWGAERVPYAGTEGWGDFFFYSERGVFASLLFFFSMQGQVGSCTKTRRPYNSAFFFSMRGQVGSRMKTRRPDSSAQIGRPGASSTESQFNKRPKLRHAANLGLGCAGLSAGPEAGGFCSQTHISGVPQTLASLAVAYSTGAAASASPIFCPSLSQTRRHGALSNGVCLCSYLLQLRRHGLLRLAAAASTATSWPSVTTIAWHLAC